MARSENQIYEELADLFPDIWTENAVGRALVRGVAAVFAARELAGDAAGGWLDMMFRGSATGAYLDAHAEQAGVERGPGESDASLQARAYLGPKILTPAKAAEELAALLPEGYRIFLVEPYSKTLNNNFFLGHHSSILTDRDESPKFLSWAFFPIPELVLCRKFFLGHDSYLDHGHLDESIHDRDRDFVRKAKVIFGAMRGYGIAWGATIDDYPQVAYFDGLFSGD